MTTEERTTLERRISEGFARLGYADGWRPADSCPQGHPNEDEETAKPLAEVGALCGECVMEWQDRQVTDPSAVRALAMHLMARGEWEDPPDTVRDDPMALANYIVTKAVLCHDQDPTWHPEWRIGRSPKRWTQDFDALTAALAWLRRQFEAWNWRVTTFVEDEDERRSAYAAKVWGQQLVWKRAVGQTPAEALARAVGKVFVALDRGEP